MWTVLTQLVITDGKTNNISLVDIVEQLSGTVRDEAGTLDKAVVPFPFHVVTLWAREDREKPESGRARTRFLAPDGENIVEMEYDVDVVNFERRRNIGTLGGIPYRGSGRYEFVVEIATDGGWARVSTVPLDVTISIERGEPAAG